MGRESGDGLTGTLGAFGLTEEDESAYLVLLSLPSATRAELARRGGTGPNQLAASLVRLQARGLVRRLPGRPARYVAAPPDAAIEALVHDHELRLQRVRATTGELLARYRAGRLALDPANLVEIIVGQDAIAQRFRELQAAATREMLVFDRPPYAQRAGNAGQLAILARGVCWRAVYTPESLELPGMPEELGRLMAAGEEARLLANLPMKLAIADRSAALVTLTAETAQDQAAVIHRSTLLDALMVLFEQFWGQAVPLAPDDRRQDADGLTDLDRRILGLLLTGAKDDAIARQLGLSERTMRRRMRALFDALGVSTRFQAGVQAARRGWI
jgi:sugar-specific transcriptional regulator TrmB/DNA-binding CsgD family transcriptional regulator